MSTDPGTFDLPTLCDRADVTPRTVRYYIQQGLLPSPGTRGAGAHYGRGHLDRLRLIKRLQREHLPLAEIRRRLSSLDDEAVAAALREAPAEEGRGSALAYVRDVLAGRRRMASPPEALQSRTLSQRESAPATGARSLAKRRAEAEGVAPVPPADVERVGAERSTWERIALTPDVELHVRRPLSRTQNKLVDRLIEQARTLFAEER